LRLAGFGRERDRLLPPFSAKAMTTAARLSYGVLVLTIALAGVLHLGAPLLVVLFSYFALRHLYRATKRKWLALTLFIVLVVGTCGAAVYFTRAAILALPEVADTSIPPATAWAQKRQIELPFTDFESLRTVVIDTLRQEAQYLRGVIHFARSTVRTLVFCLIAIVAAASLFLNGGFGESSRRSVTNNLYSVSTVEVAKRFHDFYRSFSTVIGAQLTISLINTALTGVFLIAVRLTQAPLLMAITFVCGLVPIVGNLASNTIIIFIALTVSLKLAIAAFVFLIVIHKLEYFLNSKIIGERIRNPVWLTLIALVIGERLMGIPGLVLAPVVLNYVRLEMLKIGAPEKLSSAEIRSTTEPTGSASSALSSATPPEPSSSRAVEFP
jgi:predicted PurR-regulated permease PerM